MGRISETFASLRARRAGGFIAYVTAGDPSPKSMPDVLEALVEAGTDIIELGIPFSDPLADGPTIQSAAGRALAAGMTVPKTLECVRAFRTNHDTPIVLFTYLNPIFVYGFQKFVQAAADAGADGLLILDLPPEEAAANSDLVFSGGLDLIRLVAPTTPPERMKGICSHASGFIYYVSREGVTGEQSELSSSIGEQVARLRQATDLPIAVGFGISTPEQTAQVAARADAAVVGSAIVRHIAETPSSTCLKNSVLSFVSPLARAAHSAGSIH